MTMWAIGHFFGRSFPVQILSMLAGLFVCYAFGTVWFHQVYARQNGAVGWMTVLGWCVFPFIIPDLVKIALAAVLAPRVRKIIAASENR